MCHCTTILTSFADFLTLGYGALANVIVSDQVETEIVVSDWEQANWEILVECQLCSPNEFLDIYDAGGDIYGNSSRISFKNALPTHVIKCKSKNSQVVFDVLTRTEINSFQQFQFDHFVNFDGRSYDKKPPFDHALLVHSETNREVVVALKVVEFEVAPISVNE